MKICTLIEDIRKVIAGYRHDGARIALVPTMGFLHEGHMALVDAARENGDRVITWIYVNPTQFEKADDLDAYPRDLARDIAMLRERNVDALFVPDSTEIYPPGNQTIVEVTELSNVLHGKVRPGHYRGVTSVVTRFFNIIQPDAAMFGEKDYQQLQIIKRMVRDLHMPIDIIGVPTQRAPDGLALSSRNVRLTLEDRAAAPVLHRALQQADDRAKGGCTKEAITATIQNVIASEPRATLVGLDIVRAETLEEFSGMIDGPTAIMISAQFGDVLLIDQKVVAPADQAKEG